MEKIYILGNKESQSWGASIGHIILIPAITINDHPSIHDFVVKHIKDLEPDARLIIDLDSVDDPALALTIAMHIRLSADSLNDNIYIPILLVSLCRLDTFLSLGECSQFFLARKGYSFCSTDDVELHISEVTSLTADNYSFDFLNQINIQPDATSGRHSIANLWGADVLARVSGIEYKPNESILKARKSLYFKYVLAKSIQDDSIIGRPEKINATGKKILLIDDEADKGWDICLKSIFAHCSEADFDVVDNNISDYKDLPEEIKRKIDNDHYDLYLLDLRLLGSAEEDNVITRQFSGYRLLNNVLKKNKGNQVIIMTASNKAWNIKNLISDGAIGYYIKEAPELMLPLEFSMENYNSFILAAKKAFDADYKRCLFRQINYLQNNIKRSKRLREKEITDELVGILKTQFIPFMIKVSSKEDFVAAYLILYGVFEVIKNNYHNDVNMGEKEPMTSIISTIYQRIGNGGNIWKEIEELVNARNSYIHQKKKNKIPAEFIYNKEGLLKLFNIILKIINSLI